MCLFWEIHKNAKPLSFILFTFQEKGLFTLNLINEPLEKDQISLQGKITLCGRVIYRLLFPPCRLSIPPWGALF